MLLTQDEHVAPHFVNVKVETFHLQTPRFNKFVATLPFWIAVTILKRYVWSQLQSRITIETPVFGETETSDK